jgi:hypothetical protein
MQEAERAMFRIIKVAALFVALATPVNAQTFPDRPVRILVPYAPGGIFDDNRVLQRFGNGPASLMRVRMVRRRQRNKLSRNGLLIFSALVSGNF